MTIWVARSIEDPTFVDVLADLDGLLNDPKCQIIKDQRKIKVGRIVVRIGAQMRSLYVKRYNAFSPRYKLLSPFFRSGALRALAGSSILADAGIARAAPLAGVEERRFRILRRSFFVTEEIAGAKTAGAFWTEDLRDRQGPAGFKRRRVFLGALAGLFHDLHARRTYHDDLKEANIMALAGDPCDPVRFFLLDFEGVRRGYHLSGRRKIKNLVQIYRTLGRRLSRSQQRYFLKHYLGTSAASRKDVRIIIKKVLDRAERVDAGKAGL